MIIEIVKDTNKRYCSVCRKRIEKGDLIAKYDYVIDEFRNTRVFFSHLECLIDKLTKVKKEFDVEKRKIDKVVESERKKLNKKRFEISLYQRKIMGE